MTEKNAMPPKYGITPFTGVLTLNSKAQGIKEVRVIVFDENYKPIIATARPTKEECLPDGTVQYAYSFSSPEGTERGKGEPLPGKRNSEWEIVTYEQCTWAVHCAQNSAGDWIERFRMCLGPYHPKPPVCMPGEIVSQGDHM